jgi:hypothetical protein
MPAALDPAFTKAAWERATSRIEKGLAMRRSAILLPLAAGDAASPAVIPKFAGTAHKGRLEASQSAIRAQSPIRCAAISRMWGARRCSNR